jgi:hypothetical protein
MLPNFIDALQARNGPLFIFGCFNLAIAALCLVLTWLSPITVRGANTWFKPFKFGLSIAVFSFTMGWYTYELHAPAIVSFYSWATIALLGFEVLYITLQAGKGQLSHYNGSTPVYKFLAIFMGVAAALVTLFTAYIGVLFLNAPLPNLPQYYVLSIRMGIFLFVFFAFQGATMGARSTHTIGGAEGGPALPVLNWSTRHGDLRIAHFIGMHALQVLPLLSWYVFKNYTLTLIAGLLYALLAAFCLLRALKGKPTVRFNRAEVAA